MRVRVTIAKALALLIATTAGTIALAADPPATASGGPSKEIREKMAVLHEQMAACLRSDKSIADCRDEMRKNCRAAMDPHNCPMMGMGRGVGRRTPPPDSPSPQ